MEEQEAEAEEEEAVEDEERGEDWARPPSSSRGRLEVAISRQRLGEVGVVMAGGGVEWSFSLHACRARGPRQPCAAMSGAVVYGQPPEAGAKLQSGATGLERAVHCTEAVGDGVGQWDGGANGRVDRVAQPATSPKQSHSSQRRPTQHVPRATCRTASRSHARWPRHTARLSPVAH